MRTEKQIRESLDERVRYLLENVYRVDEKKEIKTCRRCGKTVRIYARFLECKSCRILKINGGGKVIKEARND